MAPITLKLHTLIARTGDPQSLRIRDASVHTYAKRATIALSNSVLRLLGRQSTASIIPSTYGSINSGPSPGTVVGIVLGSVGGFLLLLWLIYTCLNFGTASSRSDYTESVVVARDRRKSHRGSTHSRRVSETVEVRRPPSPVRIVREPSARAPERVERVIVEESRETRRERERSEVGSDEVVVIEEHSPPRRKKSSGRRTSEVVEERRDSGYRTVDPVSYGGVVGGRKSRR